MTLLSLQRNLPVPSVQELASEPLDAVPSRYLRDDVDDPVSNPCNPFLQIPTVDMSKLLDAESQAEELHKLYSVCRDWGAFQVVNHGVADELVKSMKEKSRDFFNFPLQEKKRYAQKEGSVEGYGQTFVNSEEQKLDWSDMLFINALPYEDRKYNFWPDRPQGFREALDCYSGEVKRLALSLLGFMAKGLGLEAHKFSKDFEDGLYHVRMNYYPHCPQPQQVVGMAAHADFTGITILLEFDETQGLQIRKDGYWVPVKMLSGAFLVIVGNIGTVMSNGIYQSPHHRVVVNSLKERLTIVTFCYPHKDAIIEPAHDLINPENPALFKTLSHAEYFNLFYSRNSYYDEPWFIDILKIDA
ncbi:oxoglutarate-dependent flavonoid 7-O-demethylase 1-like isoform X1 [Magnolia sinica]|uniref:oxoglutarate-dependent flavonoid 7-O-demethylase 1-like isoform X1 n=1 Tax=Magnolia sinica TaxID=86752 RepID=UPI00265AA6E5|nr:oxoglutarate-dependent flavonoid 7-O-demethylase 1-like isoform X1 [Magnolia sinica]